jgi:type I restriction enzyme, S subunit
MKRHQLAKVGQVILSEIWGKKGAIGFVPVEGEGALCTSHFFLFDLDQSRILPGWMNYLFRANYLEKQLDEEAKGTTGYAAVRPAHFVRATIPLPPLAEQRRLVGRIDALAARVEEAKRLRGESERLTLALSTSAISAVVEELVYDGKLGDLLLGPPKNGWSARCDGLETGTPILSLGAITGFMYRADRYKWTSEDTMPNAHYWLRSGDLLISRSNTPDLVGHAAIYDGNPTPCIYPDLMMRLQPDPDRCDSRFVHYVLQSRFVRDFVKANAKGTSPTMKKISQQIVMAIPFPTNCTKERQIKIANHLDTIR